MYALTFAYLVSPVHLHCIVETFFFFFSLFSIFYFLFSFLCVHKKHKNAIKRISYFFPLRCFLSAFFIFFTYLRFCVFAWLRFGAFWCFLCFWCLFVFFVAFFVLFCACKIFSEKNNKKLKTALMTSFILLLNFQLSQSFSIVTILFNYYNPFQLSQFFSIIPIFFNYHNFFQL